MKKPISILLTLILTLGTILSYAVTAYGKPGGVTKRLSGSDRFGTSAAICQEGWTSSDYVVICTGEGSDKFADALAGAPIADMYDAPLLLTNRSRINDFTAAEIKRLKAKTAVILGGYNVVSEAVEGELKQMGLKVDRIRGADRYETAVKIAEELKTKKNFKKVFLTTGKEFQYAMMAAPFTEDMPILFSEWPSFTPCTKKALTDLKIEEVEIVGGYHLISDKVENEIKSMGIKVTRVAGNTMEDVNKNVVRKHMPNPSKMAIARNDLFADALSGAALSLKAGAPIFLVGTKSVKQVLKDYILTLNTTENYIYGGEEAVSQGVAEELISGPITIPPFEIIPTTPSVVQVGNTSSNLINVGIAGSAGDWVYFYLRSGLYKSKADGSSMSKLTDDYAVFINVIGDYIYYINESDNSSIYKLKTDNSVRMPVTDDEARNIAVLGDWIYYNGKTDDKIYRVKTDGSVTEVVSNEKADLMTIEGGWIYYNTAEGDYKICRRKLDGSGREELLDQDAYIMNVQGDWLYYVDFDTKNLYKAKISDPTTRIKLDDGEICDINVTGDWIYYGYIPDCNLYKMKTDGTGKVKLNDNLSMYYSVVGDWIYYLSDGAVTWKMKLDGTQNGKILPN